MIKNLFIGFFICLLVFALWYQNDYLSTLEKNETQFTPIENTAKMVAQALDFKVIFYNPDGTIKATLSGQKIVYYTDASFIAEGQLKYDTYNLQNQLVATVQTESGVGQLEDTTSQDDFLFTNKQQLKSLVLKDNVFFNLDGNQGSAKNVFIDGQKQTISSNDPVHSIGPKGEISANGFFYDINTKMFKLNSNVEGTYKIRD